MNELALTFDTLQSQAARRLLSYSLKQGQAGPLIFLWALGIEPEHGVYFWVEFKQPKK